MSGEAAQAVFTTPASRSSVISPFWRTKNSYDTDRRQKYTQDKLDGNVQSLNVHFFKSCPRHHTQHFRTDQVQLVSLAIIFKAPAC